MNSKNKKLRKKQFKRNKTMEQFMVNPKNYESGLIMVQCANNEKVPVINRLCPICNTPETIEILQTATDEEIIEMTHNGICHGWSVQKNGNIAVLENIVYHEKCLKTIKNLNFDFLVEKGIIKN